MPEGIAEQFVASSETFAVRYFIVDNSGSMCTDDGHRVVSSAGRTGMVSCSRWEEIGCSLSWLSKVANALKAYTEFRLLNAPANGSPQVVRVGLSDVSEKQQEDAVEAMVNSPPCGKTPLCAAIREVVRDLSSRREDLRRAGKRACVVIASDGEASDGDVADALRPLRDLPCWVVVRLCTDADKVVEYWNSVDEQLELDLDVIDDLTGEAKEVHAHAPYLAYGLALHRLREFGTTNKLIDLLDERPLSQHEILDLVALILGSTAKDQLPHPQLDWKHFLKDLGRLQSLVPEVWDPIHNKKKPWFDLRKLSRALGPPNCNIM